MGCFSSKQAKQDISVAAPNADVITGNTTIGIDGNNGTTVAGNTGLTGGANKDSTTANTTTANSESKLEEKGEAVEEIDMKNLVLGRYELVSGKKGLLGEGSFSSVQKGRDVKDGVDVAVKTYKSGPGSQDDQELQLIIKKFKRQISVLWSLLTPLDKPPKPSRSNHTLHHPAIMTVDPSKLFLKLLDYSKDSHGQPGPDVMDGKMYVVTEVADYSLKDYLAARQEEGGSMSEDTVRHISRNFVFACAVLHAKGLVHLDIKPENIMRCGATWKLIDVDGCTAINSKISINDSTISFSPCYCAPEWAHFLIEDADYLRVNDQLDVWSVGISLCELVMLDAVLKPKYAAIYRHAGSHRKAGFLFLEWLANKEESLVLDKKIMTFHKEFVDLVVTKMLTKDEKARWSLAECLNHPFIADCVVAGLDNNSSAEVEGNLVEKIQAKRRERIEELITDKPPLIVGVLYKLNSDGAVMNKEHWLKRDMWLAHNGSLCYFSQKKGKRLVLLEAAAIARGTITLIDNGECALPWCFSLKMEVDQTQDAAALNGTPTEIQMYAAENEEQRKAWVAMLNNVISMKYQNLDTRVLISKGLIEDYRNFKIQIRNRREKIDPEKAEFQSVFKRELWKLNQEGDIMNPEHWLKREMWLAKNGAFCYFSKKEDKELQYYKSEDIKSVICAELPEGESCKPFTFTLTLKPTDGLEYAPGVFAADNEETMRTFLGCIKKFQSRSRQKKRDQEEKREREKKEQSEAKDTENKK